MIPLTKILDPDDYGDPEFRFPLSLLAETEDKLHKVGLLDPLPHRHRRWEYAQGIRALLKAKPMPRVLEVGGGTSLFMPTVVYAGLAKEVVQWEHPRFTQTARMMAQLFATDREYDATVVTEENLDKALTASGHTPPHLFDFISCISVIENLEWDGDKMYYPNDGHYFMTMFLMKLVPFLAPGGILFITSDIAEKNPDHYMFSAMRPPGIWDPDSWWWLAYDSALTFGQPGLLELVEPTTASFTWTGPHVYDSYNFASMTLRRR